MSDSDAIDEPFGEPESFSVKRTFTERNSKRRAYLAARSEHFARAYGVTIGYARSYSRAYGKRHAQRIAIRAAIARGESIAVVQPDRTIRRAVARSQRTNWYGDTIRQAPAPDRRGGHGQHV